MVSQLKALVLWNFVNGYAPGWGVMPTAKQADRLLVA
jgi:hypothetical protein